MTTAQPTPEQLAALAAADEGTIRNIKALESYAPGALEKLQAAQDAGFDLSTLTATSVLTGSPADPVHQLDAPVDWDAPIQDGDA